MSIFSSYDKELNQSEYFWADLSADFHGIPEPILLKSLINLKKTSEAPKFRTLILTPTTLYFCKKNTETPKKQSIITWKPLKAFEEHNTKSSKSKSYVLVIGSQNTLELYFPTSKSLEIWLDALSSHCILTNFESDFALIQEIGRGNYATVHQAISLISSSRFAVKMVKIEKFIQSARGVHTIISEIQTMRTLNHPGFVHLHKVYEDQDTIFLVMDYIPNGSLYEKILSIKKCSEKQASAILINLLKAVDHMHKLNIVHRDIKLENILMGASPDENAVKIVDFGLACVLSENETLRCGSPGYISPEMLSQQPYTTKTDIFSIGVVLFILISGHTPFGGANVKEIFKKNHAGKLYFNGEEWSGVSKDCIDLILKLTEVNPEVRVSAEEALEHKWLVPSRKRSQFLFVDVRMVRPQVKNERISGALMERMVDRMAEKEKNKSVESGEHRDDIPKIKISKASELFKKLRNE